MSRFLPHPHQGSWCPVCQYPLIEIPCQVCSRRQKEDENLRQEWRAMLGGERAWSEYTREKYVETAYNSSILNAALAFDWKKGSFMMCGPRGTGKSHLAAIMKRPWIMAGVRVLTVFMQDLLRAAKGDMRKNGANSDRISPLVNAQVLSIEDMGVEKPSEWVVNEWYYPIIDGRYRAGRNGMLITMNQSLDELEAAWSPFDPHGRVVSRLKGMCRGNIHSLHGERDWRAE